MTNSRIFSMVMWLGLGLWIALPGHAKASEEGARPCDVPGVDALVGQLEQLERQILLTRYAEAVEELRGLQRAMTCISEPPEARQLGRMFLDLGYALHRLGLVYDGEAAFAVAAGIEPSLTWNSTFAASYGVKYYEIAQKVRSGPTVDLKVASSSDAAAWYIDGRLQGAETTRATIHPGWHFVQVAQAGSWVGDWYNLQGEVSLDLVGLLRKLDSGSAYSATSAVPIEATGEVESARAVESTAAAPTSVAHRSQALWQSSAVGLLVGVGMLGGSAVTSRRADDVYDTIALLQASYESQEEIDILYDDEYLPLVRGTNGMRVAGGALIGAGAGLALLAALAPREPMGVAEGKRLRLVAASGGLGLSGSF